MEEMHKRPDSNEKKVEEIKSKVFNWLKEPYNLALVLIMIFAFAIRLYYFWITRNQALWWDELAYGSLARNFVTHLWDGTPAIVGEIYLRPLIFSYLWAFLFYLGFGEIVNRFLLAFIPSVISVYLVYLIGAEVYNKKIGLIAAAIFSVIWLNLFYSSRFLVHMVEMVFLFSSMYFFIKSTKNQINLKQFSISLVLLSFATLTRYQDGLAFIVYFVIIILAKKLYLNKLKFWYAGIIGMSPLLLFFLMNFLTKGNIFPTLLTGTYIHAATKIPFGFHLLNFIPLFLTIPIFLFFILGLAYLIFDIVLGYNLLSENPVRRNGLFLILIMLVFFSFFIFYLRAAEDRYFFEILASLTIISAFGINFCADYIKKYNKTLAIVFIIGILLFGAYQEYKQADPLIKQKEESYAQMRAAFLWLKENTPTDSVVAGSGTSAYSIYYSEQVYSDLGNDYSLEETLKIDKSDYLVRHGFTPEPPYINEYFASHESKFEVVHYELYQGQPIVIVYKALK